MDKKRVEIIVTAVLVVVFLAVVIGSCKKIGQKVSSGAGSIAAGITAPVVNMKAKPKSAVLLKNKETIDWVRDPFSGRMYVADKKASSLRLIGIIWDENSPLAMINNKIVKAGDRIEGKFILKIMPDRVLIDDGSKEYELKLQQ